MLSPVNLQVAQVRSYPGESRIIGVQAIQSLERIPTHLHVENPSPHQDLLCPHVSACLHLNLVLPLSPCPLSTPTYSVYFALYSQLLAEWICLTSLDTRTPVSMIRAHR